MIQFIVAAAVIAAPCAPAQPTRAEIEFIESSIEFYDPPALQEYTRYYTAQLEGGQRVIVGGYLIGHLAEVVRPFKVLETIAPNVFVVAYLPTNRISDGGCSVVHVRYTPGTGKLEPPLCNFEAWPELD